jgi:hypothetical protein
MKVVKTLMLGAFLGLLYAFISFYLITPYLRQNIAVIAFYGIQGSLFALAYVFLKALIEKIILKRKAAHEQIFNILIGATSGFLSGLFNIIITYYNAVVSFSGIVAPEVKHSVLKELIYFSCGCIIIGICIGFLIGINSSRGFGNMRDIL